MKKLRKSLAVLLAIIMLASFTPLFASAADPIVLTKDNITTYPTISYKNADGKYYAGQTVGDGLIINDDEVVTDVNGNIVAGHFEFIDLTSTITLSGNGRADIKFVPDDETEYTGFEFPRCRYVTYVISKTTPVFIDENDTVPVATEVMPGSQLSTSTLSGAKVKNPYNENETKALSATWSWVEPSLVVNESGYYEAELSISSGYERLKAQVYVGVIGNAVSTEIAEAPTLKNVKAGSLWTDVVIEGGKAVVKGGTEEVAGTYSITRINNSVINGNLNYKISAIDYEIELTFNPDEDKTYLRSTTILNFTAEQTPIAFLDENGNEFIPEIKVPYGTKLDNGNFVPLYIKSIKTNYDGNLKYTLDESVEDTVPAVGTYEYTVKLSTYKTIGVTPDYADSVLPFRLIVEPVTVEMNAESVIHSGEELAQNERYYRFVRTDGENVQPKGTYDVYIDGELYADDVKTFKWLPTASKNYEFRVVYNPVENDPFTVNEWTQNVPVSMWRNIKFDTNHITSPFKAFAGSKVTVKWTGANEDFKSWVITDTNGNPIDVDIMTEKLVVDENGSVIGTEIVDGDYTSTNIIFTMPDTDIEISTNDTAPEDGSNDNSLWSFWQKLVNFIIEIYRTIVDFFVPAMEQI